MRFSAREYSGRVTRVRYALWQDMNLWLVVARFVPLTSRKENVPQRLKPRLFCGDDGRPEGRPLQRGVSLLEDPCHSLTRITSRGPRLRSAACAQCRFDF